MEDEVDGTCMIFHVQPIPNVLALSIDRQRLPVADVVDEQGDEFFRELVRPVVVGAVGHDGRHSVGIVESADKMV